MPNPESLITKHFALTGGVDARSHDAARTDKFAKDALNVEVATNDTIVDRPGTRVIANSAGGGGLKRVSFLAEDLTRTEDLLTIDDELWRLTSGSITITYSGAETDVYATLQPELDGSDYVFMFRLVAGSTTALEQSLGTGVNEASPYLISDLVTDIDALADFACVGTGDTSIPAGCLPNVADSIGAGLVISFNSWEQVYCPTSTPFADFQATLDTDNFIQASILEHANRVLIATGHTELFKYDAVSCYRAGMPAATTYAAVIAAGGALVQPETYDCFITYEQVDAQGNVVEGDASNVVSVTSSLGNQQITHTIPCIQPSSGFLTSCAMANNGGTETGTTLTVDNGAGGDHTLQVGQTAFFRDNGGTLHEREITARTSTSITIAGAAVTIANNEPISANLRINLWRNRSGGNLPYLVRTFANNSLAASISYTDNVADGSLLEDYVAPIEGHALPPANLKYLAVFQNLVIGLRGNEIVDYSDLDGPEYWNLNYEILSKTNDPTTGVGATKEMLCVFKDTEIHALQGDLGSSNYRQEVLADAIGCAAHASIALMDDALWFYSATHGVQRIIGSGRPEDMSFRVFPIFTQEPVIESDAFVHKRAVALAVPRLQQIWFFLPVESSFLPTSSSRVFMADTRSQFDYDRDYDEDGRLVAQFPKISWFPWSGINLAGGATIYDNEPVWIPHNYGDVVLATEYHLMTRHKGTESGHFADQAQPYSSLYDLGYIDLNQPLVLKKWLRARFFSFHPRSAQGFTITAKTSTEYQDDLTQSEKSIVFGEDSSASGFGNGPFGLVPFGGAGNSVKDFMFKPVMARTFRMYWERTVWLSQQAVSGVGIELVPAFRQKIKVVP